MQKLNSSAIQSLKQMQKSGRNLIKNNIDYWSKRNAPEYDDSELPFTLYQLLEDISYLKTAYNQVQEKVDNLEPDLANKFLSYPIPKAIVEEWEKFKKD